MQGIDWDRNVFITNFLTDEKLKKKYSVPGTYGTGDLKNDPSIFWSIAQGIREDPGLPKGVKSGEGYFDIWGTGRGKSLESLEGEKRDIEQDLNLCPWDGKTFLLL